MLVVALASMSHASQTWRTATGATMATIVCKITLQVHPGVMRFAPSLEPIYRDEFYSGGAWRAPSDIVPFKEGVDVLFVGAPEAHSSRPCLRIAGMTTSLGHAPARVAPRDHARWYDTPLPVHFEAGRFNAAPVAQRLSFLAPDAGLVLEHLSHAMPYVETRLPGVWPSAFCERTDAPAENVTLHCDTLWIDATRGLCTVTWRGSVDLDPLKGHARCLVGLADHDLEYAEIDASRVLAGVSAWGEHDTLEAAPAPGLSDATVPLGDLVQRAVTPFVGAHDHALPSTVAVEPTFATGTSDLAPLARMALAPEPPVAVMHPPPVPQPPRPAPLAPPDPPAPVRSPWAGATSAVRHLARPLTSGSAPPSAPEMSVMAAMDAARAASEPRAGAPEASAAGAGAATAPSGLARLIWLDPEASPRIRKRWRRLTTEHDLRPGAEEAVEPSPGMEDENRARYVIARAAVTDGTALAAAVASACVDGIFEPPLVVVDGELSLPFDEVEALRAAVTVATPFVAGDKQLREAVDSARELLQASWLEAAGALAERLTERVRDCYVRGNHTIPAAELDAHAQRMLLDRRRYQRRLLGGGERVRALFRPLGGKDAVVLYMPEAAAQALPLFTTLAARAIVEVDVRQDQREDHPLALFALCIAQRLPERMAAASNTVASR